MPRGRRSKITERQLALRAKLWPELQNDRLWVRTERHGFTTIPRTMPLILDIMDDLAKGQPVSKTYLELWCRAFDECFIVLSKPREMAFHSGFAGQRAERTWALRMRILDDLGFISIKPGPSGPLSYALIFNPYLVVKRHHERRTAGLVQAKYNALVARAIEIGAEDLEDVAEPGDTSATPGAAAVSLEDKVLF